MRALWSRADRILGALLRLVPLACLVAFSLLLCVNVAARLSGRLSMPWFDEVVLTLFAWMTFLGAAALWRERTHFVIDMVPALAEGTRAERPLGVVIALIGLAFAASLAGFGGVFVLRTTALTPILGLPQAWSYACIPLAGAAMTLYALRDVVAAAAPPVPSPVAAGAAAAHLARTGNERSG